MKKRLMIVILAVVGVVSIFALYGLLHNSSKELLYNAEPLDLTIKRPFAVSGSQKEKVLLANNRNLVRYDVVSGKTTPLMRESVLPEVLQIVWSRNGTKALINTATPIAGDGMFALLPDSVKSTDENIWWLADFATKKYSYISDSVLFADWEDETNFISIRYTNNRSNTSVYRHNVEQNKSEKLLDKASLISAHALGKNKFLLNYSENNKGKLTVLKNPNTEVVISEAVISAPSLSQDRSHVSFLVNKKASEEIEVQPSSLVVVNLEQIENAEIKNTVISNKQTSAGYWSLATHNLLFFDTKDQIYKQYDSEKSIVMPVKIASKTAGLKIRNFIADDKLIATDSNNKYYLLSIKKIPVKQPVSQSFLLSESLNVNDSVKITTYKDILKVYSQGDINVSRNSVNSYLSNNSVDPNLVDIIFESYGTNRGPLADQDVTPDEYLIETNN